MMENTEILMLMHTYWGSRFETKDQKISFATTIIDNFAQQQLPSPSTSHNANENKNDQSKQLSQSPKILKRIQHIKNALINATCSIMTKFIPTLELVQMVMK
jgi:hypothetical protein